MPSGPTILGRIFSSLVTSPLDQISELARERYKILVVGCGPSSRITFRRGQAVVGIDLFLPYLMRASREGQMSSVVRADGTSLPFKQSSFDGVLALDVIEHMPKLAGRRLIDEMNRVCRGMLLLFTPNGFFPQQSYDGNPHQEHLAGWTTDDLERLGFSVSGANGLHVFGMWFSGGATGQFGRDRSTVGVARWLFTLVLRSLPGCAHHLMAVRTK
jgi:2-polyprenyl-3-methyl-5-hydroxy-6-metoxy-1,4-benzoquinol methylase